MRVFFSHAWKSKQDHPVLPRILNQLEDELRLEVWKDNERLDARIPSIREALKENIRQADAFLLMWSAAAQQSEAVADEIDAAIELGKPMIICCLDKTKLNHPRLQDPLEIRFYGSPAEVMMAHRDLAKAIRGLYEGVMDEKTRQENCSLNAVNGSIGDIVIRGGPNAGGTERRAYLLRALRKAAAVAEGDDSDEARQIRRLKPLVALYENAGTNPHRLRAVLAEATKLGATGDPLLFVLSLKLREQIKDDLDRATGRAAEPEAVEDVHPDSEPDLTQIGTSANDFASEVESAAGAGSLQLETLFRSALPVAQANLAARLVTDYILAAPEVAKWMITQAVAGQSMQLGGVAAVLAQYWESPNDLIPDAAGLLGKLDDAWLIHTTVALCLQSEWLDPAGYPADPDRMAQASEIAVVLLPQNIHSRLVLIVRELMQSLGGTSEFSAWGFQGAASSSPSDDNNLSFEEMRTKLSETHGGLMAQYGV